MNILKFISGQFSDATKDVERKEKVINGIVVGIDSAQAISRVLHTDAYKRWDNKQVLAVVASYEKHTNKLGKEYSMLDEDGRVTLMRKVANDVSRSPCAVLAVLKAKGHCLKRGNSKATLVKIATNAKGKKK